MDYGKKIEEIWGMVKALEERLDSIGTRLPWDSLRAQTLTRCRDNALIQIEELQKAKRRYGL